MKIIGLTGPVASGKDEATRFLRRHGAYIIDADEVAHLLYIPQSAVWGKLVKFFGSKILKRGGEINRKKLAESVFADKQKLLELNRIVHPYLREEISKIIENSKSKMENRMVVVNAAVLKEIGLVDDVDEVWVVVASKEKRLKRLVKTGMSKADALKRIGVQASQKEYLEIADVVIKNEGTLKQLNEQVRACIKL